MIKSAEALEVESASASRVTFALHKHEAFLGKHACFGIPRRQPRGSHQKIDFVPFERTPGAFRIVHHHFEATVLGVPLASWLGGLIGWPKVHGLGGALSLLSAAAFFGTLPSGARGHRTTPSALIGVAGNARIAAAIATSAFQMAGQFATYAVIVAYLFESHGLSATRIPFALMLFGADGVVGNALASCLLPRFSSERLILASLIALAAVFGALSETPHHALGALILLVAWSIVGTLMMAPQHARLLALAPHARDLILALNASALYLGMAGGADLGGVLCSYHGPDALPMVSALIVLAAIGCFRFSLFTATVPAKAAVLQVNSRLLIHIHSSQGDFYDRHYRHRKEQGARGSVHRDSVERQAVGQSG